MPQQAAVEILDRNHGSSLAVWEAMGRPAFPTGEQIQQLRRTARLPAPQHLKVAGGKIELTLPHHSLALIEASATPARPAL